LLLLLLLLPLLLRVHRLFDQTRRRFARFPPNNRPIGQQHDAHRN
jgi:hypothetical protein